MIEIEKNKSLLSLNTFSIDVKAAFFTSINSQTAIQELLHHPIYQNEKHLLLGGGSNLLFKNDFEGLIIKNDLKGISIVEENDETITLEVAAGEVWHDIVLYCVTNNWGGIENLSLIPGTMGAAPIQNIGAYGVEIKDVIKKVDGIELKSGKLISFSNAECNFGYRESIFKHVWQKKIFISSVTLTLTKKSHRLNTSYGAIQETLKQLNVITPTIQSVSEAVIKIRESKLPNPKVIGNAGSFFKNPSISLDHFQLLQKNYLTIPSYPSVNQELKIPAGWLIEQCGWKGKKINDVGVHSQQALVLVNYGRGNGKEIFNLAMKIQASVKEKFNIILTPEVNIIE